jgi:hypothetical protein
MRFEKHKSFSLLTKPLIGTYADGKIYIDGGNIYVPSGLGTFYNTSSGAYSKGMSLPLPTPDHSCPASLTFP